MYPYSINTNEHEQLLLSVSDDRIASEQLHQRIIYARSWDCPIYSLSFLFARFLDRIDNREDRFKYIEQYYTLCTKFYFIIEELDIKFISHLFSVHFVFNEEDLESNLIRMHQDLLNYDNY